MEPDPVGLGEGEAEADPEVLGLLLGLDEALLLGAAEALSVALGVAVALLLALGVVLAVAVALAVALAVAVALGVARALAVALAVEDALVLADGEAELVALDVEVLGVVDAGSETASRMIADCPSGTARAADVVAGGWPQALGAFTALAFAALAVLASAAVPLPRRPPMMVEERMAAPATILNAEDPERADLMAAPSSPCPSSSRPRVSSD